MLLSGRASTHMVSSLVAPLWFWQQSTIHFPIGTQWPQQVANSPIIWQQSIDRQTCTAAGSKRIQGCARGACFRTGRRAGLVGLRRSRCRCLAALRASLGAARALHWRRSHHPDTAIVHQGDRVVFGAERRPHLGTRSVQLVIM